MIFGLNVYSWHQIVMGTILSQVENQHFAAFVNQTCETLKLKFYLLALKTEQEL